VFRVRRGPVLRRVLAGRAWPGRRAGTPPEEVCLGEEARYGGVTMRCGGRALCAGSPRIDCVRRQNIPAGQLQVDTPVEPAGVYHQLGRIAFTFAFAPRSAARWSAVWAFAFAVGFPHPAPPRGALQAFCRIHVSLSRGCLCMPKSACPFAVPCSRPLQLLDAARGCLHSQRARRSSRCRGCDAHPRHHQPGGRSFVRCAVQPKYASPASGPRTQAVVYIHA
jgi:hypothetical protein